MPSSGRWPGASTTSGASGRRSLIPQSPRRSRKSSAPSASWSAIQNEQGDSQFYRRQLKAVARAIYAHRAALEDGEVIAEEHDFQLWSALDTVTVPNGPLSVPTGFMAMLDERVWS